ncbi:efflux transporter, RND family, MFP subunit [Synechococcus sp. PCC 7335]|uniref:efflux RND transporter periplasmic adaptor subunit n=1 Tax=Synechococcus sp. (strain ATCC 29403 / PCC 7335) TaxID=91464 RepID=UPI00017EBCD6|nr:efflux RND transporter periplasmic adaptor subunit [Synechococcus sp. PCC 7335]EDX83011.1 efflux transporter, RND family, MFP subunit [Synechococcus sp. PCC 7335]
MDSSEGSVNKEKEQNAQSHRRLIGILLASVLLSGSFGYWVVLNRRNSDSQALSQAPPPRPVEVARLAVGEGVSSVELIGQAEARTNTTLRSQTSGVVQKILVQSGDRVDVGTTVAVLDDADQQLLLSQAIANLASEQSNLAELETGTRPEIIEQRTAVLQSAEAREQEARDNLQRTQALVAQGALSERSLIEARTAVDAALSAKLESSATLAEATAGPTAEELAAQRAIVTARRAAVEQAELSLSRTRLQTTISGVVEERVANVGDYMEAGEPVLSLVDREDLDVFLEIPEELSGQIAPGLTVMLTARALPGWQGQATIDGVIPTANETSRRQRVRLQIENTPAGLLPGMSVQGTLERASDTPSFVISRDALVQQEGEWIVFTVADGQANEIAVELVADTGEAVAIASEQLRSGQSVVVRGASALRAGAAVQVIDQ